MAREDPQLRIRLPIELKEKIQEQANKNNRSMNAEIVYALEQSLTGNKRYNKDEVLEYVNTALSKFEELIINHKKDG